MLKRGRRIPKYRLLATSLVLICLLFINFQPLLGQNSHEEQEEKKEEKEKTPQEKTEYPKKLKSKKTWEYIVNFPGRILFLPFWLLDQAMKPVLSLVGIAPQVKSKLAKFLISADGRRGVLPTYQPRTGAGLKFFLKDFPNPDSRLTLSSRFWLRWRQDYSLRLQRLSLGGPIVSDIWICYRYFPDEDFFGIGNDSKLEERKNFSIRQFIAQASFGLDIKQKTNLSAILGFDKNSISGGMNPDIESIMDLPTHEKDFIPGLYDHPAFLSLHFQLLHDSKDRKANPSKGWETNAKGGLYWDVNNNTYAFWKISADVTKYVHLFYDRTLVFRVAAEITEPVGSKKIPFYYLSELGRTETIRGFNRGRFRDRHMVLCSMEYRFPLMKRDNFQLGLDACYFIDVGQVSQNMFQEFSMKDFHVGFGGGFRLFSYNGHILQVLVSKSRERFRLYVMLY